MPTVATGYWGDDSLAGVGPPAGSDFVPIRPPIHERRRSASGNEFMKIPTIACAVCLLSATAAAQQPPAVDMGGIYGLGRTGPQEFITGGDFGPRCSYDFRKNGMAKSAPWIAEAERTKYPRAVSIG